MCSTHDVVCKKCGKEIAFWSMYNNVQYAEEWECCGAILDYEYNPNLEKNVLFADAFSKDKIDPYIKTHKLTNKDWSYCYLINHTHFCKRCAKKYDYVCPECGGKIIKVRDENGYCVSNY